MIPTRCPICESSRVFLDGDRLLCHDCGEPSYWESWNDFHDEEEWKVLELPFRKISDEAREKRRRGEGAHFPKTWRHWYYYRSSSQSFLGWIDEMLEQVDTRSQLSMLACEVRDQFERGNISQEEREVAKKKLVEFEQTYGLDVLCRVKGF